jgi:alkylation response protein AidB-like acyl-CoA dehydrogenase
MDDVSARQGALQRAVGLHELISTGATASERLGRPTDAVAAALLENRLLSILLPAPAGGLGGSRLDLFDAVEAIARADGSAGWCASVCNTVNHTAFIGLPADGRNEVFAGRPVSIWTSLQPKAVATPEPGGFRVSCPGTFGSGSSLSDWVLVAANTGEAQEGRYRGFLVPKAEVEIRDGSWDVMGLRATASIDYQITDRFVPSRRSWEYSWTTRDTSGPLSATEAVRLNAVGLAAFASGVGLGALADLIGSARTTRRTAADGLEGEDAMVQFGLGEIGGRMGAARSHLAGLVAIMDERAAAGSATTADEGLAISQACLTLARAARDAVVFAFDHAGASVIYAHQPLQRRLRDIFTGLKHASFTPALLSLVGKQQLGVRTSRKPI